MTEYQIITWLGKPVQLVGPTGNPLPRKGGTRGRFWLFTQTNGYDGIAQEKDLFITVIKGESDVIPE